MECGVHSGIVRISEEGRKLGTKIERVKRCEAGGAGTEMPLHGQLEFDKRPLIG